VRGIAAARPSQSGIVGIEEMTSISRWIKRSTQPP
jgi:hypothetical protein